MTALPVESYPLFDGIEFASIGTLLPNGWPHLAVSWIARDGDDVLISTVKGRRTHLNLVSDPRITVLVRPEANPYSYIEVRGTATLTEEGGRELIDALALKYRGWERYPADDGTDNVRVVVRIIADKVVSR